MTSPETAVPLQELGDVLQRPKPLIRQNVKENIWVKNARMGANSLMELWREGMANAEIEKMKRDREEERSATTGLRRVSLVNRRRERSRAAARGEGEGETWVDWRGR